MTDVTKLDFRLDDDKLLSAWGFSSSNCAKCGIHNSELQGTLIQCGKCKKAYYCSMRCFNSDLMAHKKFCTTMPWEKDPGLKKTPVLPPRPFVLNEPIGPDPPSPKKRVFQKKVPIVDDDGDDGSVQSSSSSAVWSHSSGSKSAGSSTSIQFLQEDEESGETVVEVQEEPVQEEAEPVLVMEGEDSESEESVSGRMGYLSVGDDDGDTEIDKKQKRLLKGTSRAILSPREVESNEHVSLRQTESPGQKEYGWERPEWASESFRDLPEYERRLIESKKPEWAMNPNLRKTYKGDPRLACLDPDSPERAAGSSDPWKKDREKNLPEWAIKSPLKKTERSDIIKLGGKLEKPTTHIREYLERSGKLNTSRNNSGSFSFDDSKSFFENDDEC